MKSDIFQSWAHCWVFQICWHIETNALATAPFRIWSTSAGIPSLPQALLIVMLFLRLTWLHTQWWLAFRWVTTPLWLSQSLRLSLLIYLFCIFLLPLFNLFCSFRSLAILSFFVPILAWKFPSYLQFSLRDFQFYPFCCFPVFLCVVPLRRPSYISLLFSGTLKSADTIFPSILCLSLVFFPQLFEKPP